MSGRRIALPLAIAAVLFTAAPALAEVRLGLGADYWIPQGGVFDLTLGLDTPLAKHLHLGGRFGALVTTTPTVFGVPLDLDLRFTFERVYLEGLVGPWILFTGDPVRAHAAFGFGLQTSVVSFGLEVGYLTPGAVAGLRVAFHL